MEHPIFQAFQSTDFGDLTEITVLRHRSLQVDRAVPLLFSADGDPLHVRSAGRRRDACLSWDFRSIVPRRIGPCIRPSSPSLDRCLNHCAGRRHVTRIQCEPGATCMWKIPPGRAARQLQLASTSRKRMGQWNDRSRWKTGRRDSRCPISPDCSHCAMMAHPKWKECWRSIPRRWSLSFDFSATPDVLESWKRPTEELDSSREIETFD